MKVKEKRLRGKRGSAELRRKQEGKEGGRRREQRARCHRWIIAPPRSVGAWSRSGKDGNNEKITLRAGYGGVFTPDGDRASKSGNSSEGRAAARGRLARCGTLYQFTILFYRDTGARISN